MSNLGEQSDLSAGWVNMTCFLIPWTLSVHYYTTWHQGSIVARVQ